MEKQEEKQKISPALLTTEDIKDFESKLRGVVIKLIEQNRKVSLEEIPTITTIEQRLRLLYTLREILENHARTDEVYYLCVLQNIIFSKMTTEDRIHYGEIIDSLAGILRFLKKEYYVTMLDSQGNINKILDGMSRIKMKLFIPELLKYAPEERETREDMGWFPSGDPYYVRIKAIDEVIEEIRNKH